MPGASTTLRSAKNFKCTAVGGRPNAHGRSTVIRVGPPGGLAISNVPSTDAARLASPVRPVPRTGSAPPAPSSLTMMCSRSPARCTTTSAWLAWACLVMLVRLSDTTK
jgi:hypothetical protein